MEVELRAVEGSEAESSGSCSVGVRRGSEGRTAAQSARKQSSDAVQPQNRITSASDGRPCRFALHCTGSAVLTHPQLHPLPLPALRRLLALRLPSGVDSSLFCWPVLGWAVLVGCG